MTTRAFDTSHLPSNLATSDYARTDFLTTTKPEGDRVIDLGYASGRSEDLLFLQPFGSDAAGEAFRMRIIGWNKCRPQADLTTQPATELWIGFVIAEVDVTLGNIAASELGTDNYLADTIAEVTGDGAVKYVSHASDIPAYLVVDPMGAQLVEIDVDVDGSAGTTAASGNVLWRWVSE